MEERAVDPQVDARRRSLVRELVDEIRSEAYFLWEERGCPHESAWVDWFKAEEKVISAATKAMTTLR